MGIDFMVIAVIGAAVAMVGGVFCAYQLYRLVQVDAVCRGLKHPKFWGLFAVSGSNSTSGLLMYLIGRRRFPILAMSDEQSASMTACKKKIGVGLVFLAIGAIACVLGFMLMK